LLFPISCWVSNDKARYDPNFTDIFYTLHDSLPLHGSDPGVKTLALVIVIVIYSSSLV
jgi:hypothetical protein